MNKLKPSESPKFTPSEGTELGFEPKSHPKVHTFSTSNKVEKSSARQTLASWVYSKPGQKEQQRVFMATTPAFASLYVSEANTPSSTFLCSPALWEGGRDGREPRGHLRVTHSSNSEAFRAGRALRNKPSQLCLFTEGETDAPRGQRICSRSHRARGMEWELRQPPGSQPGVPTPTPALSIKP